MERSENGDVTTPRPSRSRVRKGIDEQRADGGVTLNRSPRRGKRGCTYLTKAGEPCPSQEIHGAGYCLAHAPADVRESLGFIARNGKGGRPRLDRPLEVLRKMIGEGALLVIEPHLTTLGLAAVWNPETQSYDLHRKPPERVLVFVGIDEDTGKDVVEERWVPAGARMTSTQAGYVNMSEYEDLGAKMRASEEILSRAFGRPGSSLAITGADGGPVSVEIGPAMNAGAAARAAELAEALGDDDA